MSSTSVNTAGTMTSVSAVEVISPPMTAIAMGARNSAVAAQAEGHRQHAGDHGDGGHDDGTRALVARLAACAVGRSLPARISSMAKSTSRIEFLATMPISIRKPMITDSDSEVAGEQQRDRRAAHRQRQRGQDGDRLEHAREQQHQHREHHQDAGAHGEREVGEQLVHVAARRRSSTRCTPCGRCLSVGRASIFFIAGPSSTPIQIGLDARCGGSGCSGARASGPRRS